MRRARANPRAPLAGASEPPQPPAKRKAQSCCCAWATRTSSILALNAFVLVVLLYEAGTLYARRRGAGEGALAPDAEWKAHTRTHAGYAHVRQPSDARAAAAVRALAADREDLLDDPGPPRSDARTQTQTLAAVGPPDLDALAPLLARPPHSGAVVGGRGAPPLAHAYVLTPPGCRAQWGAFVDASARANWRAHRVKVWRARRINLRAPPVPLGPVLELVVRHQGHTRAHSALRRRIAYLAAQRAAWRAVVRAGHPHALIIDAHLFPTDAAVARMDQWLAEAGRRPPWHVLLLRRMRPRGARDGAGSAVVEAAHQSTGAGAYIISQEGARRLLAAVRTYRGPLDDEFSRLRADLAGALVVLAPPCDAEVFCDQHVRDITTEHARRKYACAWRAVEEAHRVQRLLGAV